MPASEGTRLQIAKPDDFHLHLRDRPAMGDVLPHSVLRFARAIIMPNLKSPVLRVSDALQYRERILEAVPEGVSFTPLMTLYLSETTTPEEIQEAKRSGAIFGVKLYPAGATTNSEFGVHTLDTFDGVFERMEREEIPLLVHGEITDSDVDIFDRERIFIERTLHPLIKKFEGLKVVLEHLSTTDAVSFVLSAPERVAGTITPHHLMMNRNHLLAGGLRPHHYCLPILKREEDRLSLVQAAVSGNPKFFAGTDSAPHGRTSKECACGSAGIYSASSAVEFYAEVFDEEEALSRLEGFLSRYGARFYGLPVNEEKITLVKRPTQIPGTFTFGDQDLVPLRAGGSVEWSIEE